MFFLVTRFFRRYAITSNNRQLKKIIFDHSFYQTFIHYPIRNFSIQISTQALGNELHNFCTHSGRREASAYEAVWLRAKTSACGAKRMGKVGPRRNHKEFTRGVSPAVAGQRTCTGFVYRTTKLAVTANRDAEWARMRGFHGSRQPFL